MTVLSATTLFQAFTLSIKFIVKVVEVHSQRSSSVVLRLVYLQHLIS